MPEKYLNLSIEDIVVGDPLPAPIYVFIANRYVTFRAEGDIVDRNTYERLEIRKVTNLFIDEKDAARFQGWKQSVAPEPAAPLPPEVKEFPSVRDETQRALNDIFQNDKDPNVARVMEASRKLVGVVTKFPYAVSSLTQLHTYSRNTVHHSVNVSILSVYLGLQMGYSHSIILQNLAAGALLHDLGKSKIRLDDNDTPETVEAKMKEHPTLSLRLLEAKGNEVPKEVLMIVAQHHECHDGTGFPKKLRGNNIYDLARIVNIANVFDRLVSDGTGSLLDRQRRAIMQMEQVLYHKFDPEKLEKALRILKLGV